MQRSESIKERVRQFLLRSAHDRGVTPVADSESLIRNGVVDSLGVFKLVAFLEETFSVRIRDEEILYENFDSINRIEQFVSSKLAPRERK